MGKLVQVLLVLYMRERPHGLMMRDQEPRTNSGFRFLRGNAILSLSSRHHEEDEPGRLMGMRPIA